MLGTSPTVDPPAPGDLAEPELTDAPPATTEPELTDATDPVEPPPPPPPPRETTSSTASTTSASTTSTSTTSTTQPPAPPRFTVLTVTYLDSDECSEGVRGRRYELMWDTVGADHVVISGPGVIAAQRGVSGTLRPCIDGFDVAAIWEFTATGVGGSTMVPMS